MRRLVGLTGGIGSGKSTVASLLRAKGATVVDADEVARAVVEPGEPALTKLVERFGDGILDADGRLDRPALAAVAFADEDGRPWARSPGPRSARSSSARSARHPTTRW
jgi:dephospho-CoA kinase